MKTEDTQARGESAGRVRENSQDCRIKLVALLDKRMNEIDQYAVLYLEYKMLL